MVTLGIDLSTQSCTVLALDCNTASNLGTWSFHFDNPSCIQKYGISAETKTLVVSEEGRYAQPPGMFLYALDAVFQAMQNERFDFSLLRAVAVSAQQHGHVYLNHAYAKACQDLQNKNAHEKPLEEHFTHCYAHAYAPIWMTSNTAIEAHHLKTRVTNILERTGSNSPLRFTGAIIRKTARDNPKDYKTTARIHLLSSFFASVLSSNPKSPIDYGNGAGTSLMNYTHKTWDAVLLNACAEDLPGGAHALRESLPPIDSPLSLCGHIAQYFVNKYGFSPTCVVAVGSGDNPQTKVLSKDALLSLGSSFVMMSESYDSVEHVVFHPQSNAMYDGLARPFLFACRTNGALVWDRVRALYKASIANAEAALHRIAIGSHSSPMLWQPLEESFPQSPVMPWTPTAQQDTENTSAFCKDYACLVDTVLALMACATHFMQQKTQYARMNITGGPASSQALCMRVSAFWGCPVVCMGSVGAGMGAALCAAKAIDPTLQIHTLAESLIAHPHGNCIEAPRAMRVQAKEFMQRVQAQFQHMLL